MRATLVDAHPAAPEAQRAYVSVLRAWARGQSGLVARTFPPPPPVAPRRISAIVCSIDRAKFDAVARSFRQRFAGHAFELVGLHDARSLAEAYNRGAAQATGEVLVICARRHRAPHRRFPAPRASRSHDGIGIAGASKVTGPRWDHAGQRHMHGSVLHVPPDGRPGVLLMAAGSQHRSARARSSSTACSSP